MVPIAVSITVDKTAAYTGDPNVLHYLVAHTNPRLSVPSYGFPCLFDREVESDMDCEHKLIFVSRQNLANFSMVHDGFLWAS